MIIYVLKIVVTVYAFVAVAYMLRHYIFTFKVLRKPTTPPSGDFENRFYEPTISILIPARNEANVIDQLLQGITELSYSKKKMQVIVIDDASSDATGQIADMYSQQFEFITVVHRDRKVGGRGKPSAINACLHLLTGEIVLFFDADYRLQKNIIEKLVKAFVCDKVGAVQGRPVVLNEPNSLITKIVALERTGGYRVNQEARELFGLIAQFGGTIGGFRRSLIEELGTLDESMLTEDTDLTFLTFLHGYRVRYIGNAECYEEAVNSWSAYWKQRHRWALGHMQVCFKHSWSVVNSKKLRLKEKIDGLLLLHLYFMPVATLFSWLAGITLIISEPSDLSYTFWYCAPMSLYIVAANIAPFFEIGMGTYLDGRKRIQWLLPLLIFSYLLNILICTKAFFDLLLSKIVRNRKNSWVKTHHLGGERSFSPN